MANLYSFYNQLSDLGVLSKTNLDIHSDATLTALENTHYLLNTELNTIILTLPDTPTNGDVVGFSDYKGFFGTNSVTVNVSAGQTIVNSVDTQVILDRNYQLVEFAYWDGIWSLTKGESLIDIGVDIFDLLNGVSIPTALLQLTDNIFIQDSSDSDNLKSVTVAELEELISGLNNFVETKYNTGVNLNNPAVSLIAQGNETNLSIIFKPKGNGSLLASIPDGATEGNTRGIQSVDWQLVRGTNTEVASGNYSVLAGGNSNTASGDYSSVLGGNSNIASGDYSSTLGGDSNIASGDYSVAAGLSADTSSVYGKYAFSSGVELVSGDAQFITQVFRNKVLTNSVTPLTSDSSDTAVANNSLFLRQNGIITVNFVAQAHTLDNVKLKSWNGVISLFKTNTDTEVTVIKQVFNSFDLLGTDNTWELDFIKDVSGSFGYFTFVNTGTVEDVIVTATVYGVESMFVGA